MWLFTIIFISIVKSYLSDYRRHGDSVSVGSAVSRDSLDQFCRDADFGSSLNLEVDPQVKECVNEQPTLTEDKTEKTGNNEANKANDKAVLNDAIESSLEYEGTVTTPLTTPLTTI